ncbi:phospho-N-acetylmuramoyl-pentapeptide-transferase [candidate division KSB1 bacterium]
MLFELTKYLYSNFSDFSFFRIFNYISSRAIFAALTAFFILLFFGNRMIVYLHRKNYRDMVRDFGLVTSFDKKGTPTSGGILILIAIFIPTLLWCDPTNRFIQIVTAALFWFGGLGFVDDYLKKKNESSQKGLNWIIKLILQMTFGAALGFILLTEGISPISQDLAANLYVPFYKHAVADLGWLYIPFIVFVVAAISNSVNLADGMDGLAIMPVNFAYIVYGIFAFVIGNRIYSEYLLYSYIPGAGELSIFCGAVFGAGLGFLWYNSYPAQIFMGDTGSISLGGILATLAVLLKQEILFLILGGFFVIEAATSLIQSLGIKYLGKRIFYRAPIHHNLEYKGLAETKVVVRVWVISGILALISLATLKLR